MSDIRVEARWEGGLRFEAVGAADVPITVDGAGESGITPVETLGVSLAACMAADVVDILGRMRVPMEGLRVVLEGDRATDPPRRYTAIRLRYEVDGVAESDGPKLDRAVALSREKYCSVIHTLDPNLDIDIRIEAG